MNIATAVDAPWWKEITKAQWRVLLAGQMGWALDMFDVFMYVFVITTIMKEWNLTATQGGFLASVTLFSSSFGGIAFGVIADRIGRKKALMATVLVFSLCSGLSGLAQNVTQLAIARFVLGLGMGGEWATGALLVSETWPKEHRGKAIGLMQGGGAIGYILAAIVATFVLPVYGWRAMFFIGILPALFTLYIRSKIDDPAIWVEHKNAKKRESFELFQIFKADLLRFTFVSTLVSAFVMFGYWGLFAWMPSFLASSAEHGGAGLSLVKSSSFMIPTMIGALIGYITFGFFADRFGRRPTFAFYLVASAVLVFVFGNTRDVTMLVIMGPFIGFFGSGYYSAFGAFISELYPTRARGAGIGFCYNVGRMASAFAPTVVGYFSIQYGLGGALTITAVAFLGGAISIYAVPETKGWALE